MTTTTKEKIGTRPAQTFGPVITEWQHADTDFARIGYRCEVRLVPEDGGGFSSYVAELAGVVSQGDTEADALANAIEALRGCLLSYASNNMPIPWRELESASEKETSHWVVVDG